MMSLEQKKAYLETIRKRYKKATKKQKAIILDEFCSVCEYNRKYAVRLLRKKQKKKGRRPGRKPKYDALNIMKPLKAIWFACDQARS